MLAEGRCRAGRRASFRGQRRWSTGFEGGGGFWRNGTGAASHSAAMPQAALEACPQALAHSLEEIVTYLKQVASHR